MIIKNSDKPFEIDVKRFYTPVEISDECPECGVTNESSNTDNNYFSHPYVNRPERVLFYCEECEHEWENKVILRITIEAV